MSDDAAVMPELDLASLAGAEQNAALEAAYRERKLREADVQVDALSEREKLFIEEAWHCGAQAARNDLAARLVCPHAVTLDAKEVRRTVDGWSGSLSVFAPPGWKEIGGHYDQRLVKLVRTVERMLEGRNQ